jgi:hypothetical protein
MNIFWLDTVSRLEEEGKASENGEDAVIFSVIFSCVSSLRTLSNGCNSSLFGGCTVAVRTGDDLGDERGEVRGGSN